MALVTQVIYDDDEQRVIREYDDAQPLGERLVAVRTEWKPGSPGHNRELLLERARTAIATLEAADANWATLTPEQKDAALRLSMRVTAKLARLLVGRLDAA